MPEVNRVNLWRFVNAYLVEEDDGLTLVDTTMSRGAPRILAAAAALGQPIRRILLTHAHDDHAGGLDRLRVELPEAEVIIGEREARLLEKDFSLDPGEPQHKPTGALHGTKTRPTRTINDGEHVGSLRAVFSPGHTPGHMAFLDERDDTLYCGDVYSSLGGVASSARMNPRFPPIVMGTWDKPLDLQSARTLHTLDAARLAPGHGRVVESPGAQMAAAIERAS